MHVGLLLPQETQCIEEEILIFLIYASLILSTFHWHKQSIKIVDSKLGAATPQDEVETSHGILTENQLCSTMCRFVTLMGNCGQWPSRSRQPSVEKVWDPLH